MRAEIMDDREPTKKRLGYRTFLNMGFLAFVLVVLVTGAFSIYGLRFVNRATDEMSSYMGGIERSVKTITEQQEPLIRGLEEMRRHILEAQLNLYMTIAGYKQTITEVWPHVEALQKRIGDFMATPSREDVQETLRRINLRINEYRSVLKKLENLRNLNQSEIDELGAQALAVGARISDLSQSLQEATQKEIQAAAQRSMADALTSIKVAEGIREGGRRVGAINMTAVALGVIFSLVIAFFVRGAITSSIQTLHEGARLIGQGNLDHRLSVETEDEIGKLAKEFNQMAGQLQEAYSGLERKVEERTRALTQSLEELRAMGEIVKAVNSSLDLRQVLTTVATNAAHLSKSDMAAIFEFDEALEEFRITATYQMSASLVEALHRERMTLGKGVTGQAALLGQPVQIPDVLDAPDYTFRDISKQEGFRATMSVPMIREGRIIGGLSVLRKTPGLFAANEVDLLTTFANQCVIAIENARLFRELNDKNIQLERATRYKSEFLANMSHELRTPMNSILGFTELMLDGIYGAIPEALQDPINEMHKSGEHLLRLINDVLDLSKIEAGKMELSYTECSMEDIIHSVVALMRPLANEKNLRLIPEIEPDLPIGVADEKRVSQVFINLVGNAVKFTKEGEVRVGAKLRGNEFLFSVSDTGPGIKKEDLENIFREFVRLSGVDTKESSGTGLGLSISKKIVELHGGRIWLESEWGKGSTFLFTIPVQGGKAEHA